MTIQLELPKEQVDRIDAIARARKQDINEMLADAITAWLEAEAKRQHGWQTLREFAGSFASGQPNNDFARNHDKYLYDKP